MPAKKKSEKTEKKVETETKTPEVEKVEVIPAMLAQQPGGTVVSAVTPESEASNPAVAALAAVGNVQDTVLPEVPEVPSAQPTTEQASLATAQVTAAPEISMPEADDDEPKNGKTWFWVILGFVIGAVLGGGGVYLVLSKALPLATKSTKIVTSTPVPAAEEAVTPTPEGVVRREDVKLKVLNGSGVKGAAGEAKTLLEGLGYQDVQAGNAEVSDAVKTEIFVTVDQKELLKLLEEDLSKSYDLASGSSELEAASEFDAMIVLGRKKS
ncbi:MAG: Transcriptional attenuator, LytR family [Candidatus Amesbacteria bacterium GW2011_GWB1_47_19]|nr:MAG: Transcriptional attenuator, LytR family [Candidatus Amesbacteria bacterium GW2011_GWA1_44_24]KKU31632.1 MAG: Transcriptional attenuator, LytR family [Candidatus Amesbacteria bacterium GW2011_GWC1_46_24]KKU67405.1 MAG: Transcriptional attenuator, LytR family [Candidatus Amesbacteria bacterium GW2011_GWB1_47_19]OGD05377.1 MAG: hypothetical protein A2379_05360 [Candidatus Amesbacteria bacterium RIFOXYB1_FULL_47_13]HBC72544.1 hypothetical protein [Candidatus Amesbacteria bacterium]